VPVPISDGEAIIVNVVVVGVDATMYELLGGVGERVNEPPDNVPTGAYVAVYVIVVDEGTLVTTKVPFGGLVAIDKKPVLLITPVGIAAAV
jgi:hypothetical protein